jgi:hypothetical protein
MVVEAEPRVALAVASTRVALGAAPGGSASSCISWHGFAELDPGPGDHIPMACQGVVYSASRYAELSSVGPSWKLRTTIFVVRNQR